MFYKLLLAVVILISSTILPQTTEKKNGYVGVETCGMCHKSEKSGNQLGIWKETKHSKAYVVLTTQRADSIALAKGFKTPAAKTDECLQCHVSGNKVDSTLIGAKFKMEDGVQCETCHGPGSNYKSASIMKDKSKAIENGLMIYSDIEAYCQRCHNQNSPTFVKRDMKEMWEKIKHPTPKTK